MMVANFTPDPINWMHIGVDGTLAPGKIEDFNEHRANHILNKFGPRGLVLLKFGDNPEEKKRIAMETWKSFWLMNITRFNQDNERRQQSNREYVSPGEDLVAHAQILGIKLLGPWTNVPTENSELQKLKSENLELKGTVTNLVEQVKTLLTTVKSAMAGGTMPPELLTPEQRFASDIEIKPAEKVIEPVVEDNFLSEHKDKRNKYIRLSQEQFAGWIFENVDMVQSWPSVIVDDMVRKWVKFYPDQPWPLPR